MWIILGWLMLEMFVSWKYAQGISMFNLTFCSHRMLVVNRFPGWCATTSWSVNSVTIGPGIPGALMEFLFGNQLGAPGRNCWMSFATKHGWSHVLNWETWTNWGYDFQGFLVSGGFDIFVFFAMDQWGAEECNDGVPNVADGFGDVSTRLSFVWHWSRPNFRDWSLNSWGIPKKWCPVWSPIHWFIDHL